MTMCARCMKSWASFATPGRNTCEARSSPASSCPPSKGDLRERIARSSFARIQRSSRHDRGPRRDEQRGSCVVGLRYRPRVPLEEHMAPFTADERTTARLAGVFGDCRADAGSHRPLRRAFIRHHPAFGRDRDPSCAGRRGARHHRDDPRARPPGSSSPVCWQARVLAYAASRMIAGRLYGVDATGSPDGGTGDGDSDARRAHRRVPSGTPGGSSQPDGGAAAVVHICTCHNKDRQDARRLRTGILQQVVGS